MVLGYIEVEWVSFAVVCHISAEQELVVGTISVDTVLKHSEFAVEVLVPTIEVVTIIVVRAECRQGLAKVGSTTMESKYRMQHPKLEVVQVQPHKQARENVRVVLVSSKCIVGQGNSEARELPVTNQEQVVAEAVEAQKVVISTLDQQSSSCQHQLVETSCILPFIL